jgi:hypothetical protein
MDLIGSIRLFLAAMGPLAAEGNRAEGDGREGNRDEAVARVCLRDISGVYRLQRGGVRWKAETETEKRERRSNLRQRITHTVPIPVPIPNTVRDPLYNSPRDALR